MGDGVNLLSLLKQYPKRNGQQLPVGKLVWKAGCWYKGLKCGEVTEWLKVHAWKACVL